MSSRATEDQLSQLHGALALAAQVRLAEARSDPERPLTAAEFTAFARFLKDNNVTSLPGSPRLTPIAEGLAALNEDLPDGVFDINKFRTSE